MADDVASPAPEPKVAELPSPAAATPKGADGESPRRGMANQQAKNPLGPDERAFNEAYERGRMLSTGGPMAFMRDADVQEMHVGDRYYNYASAGGANKPSSGSVRKEELHWVRARYVPVKEYEDLRGALKRQPLLLLWGHPGTGRFTTGVRLLDEFASNGVSRFDVGQLIGSLTASDFESGRGYVLELPGASGMALPENALDKLRDLVEKSGSFLVLVTEGSSASHGGYAVHCSPPDRDELLERHLAEEVRPDDSIRGEDLLDQLASNRRLTDALGPAPRPAETAQMARLLAEFGRGEIELEEVEQQAARMVHQQVVDWFAGLAGLPSTELREALQLAAFRIALAVLDKSPYHMIVEASRVLSARFLEEQGSQPSRRQAVFVDDQRSRLPSSRAEIVDGFASFGLVRLPVGLAGYSDPRLPVVLLSYVWQHHHNLRLAVVDWLKALSKDSRPHIWVRAAQAAGLFCSLDFHVAFDSMIRQGASAAGKKRAWQRRWFAALALDQAARDERVAEAVDERLKYWRRHGSGAELWTAALAWGYDLGRRTIEVALEELRILGTPVEQRAALDECLDHDQVVAAAYSVANLFAFGEVGPVIDVLDSWTASERQSLRELAWHVVVQLMHMHGFHLDRPSAAAGRSERPLPQTRERWPLLLALQDDDPRLTMPISGLIYWGMRGRRGDRMAKVLFGPWIRAAEKDQDCLRALVRFVPNLIRDESDASRLIHLVKRMRLDWCDPLKDRPAALLENAITMPGSREGVL
ncbi:hypothetical protein JOF53_001991 [Crossiella equi]|uniref:ATP-binding protein n=1 Tax=Crossiella equi TaxID=130796 RepID=A0ABS5A951_9PSEU|nr:hypothetical protein [Crossiella equi]MBP2473119.1 hypothetical protein [Crossiella equi]